MKYIIILLLLLISCNNYTFTYGSALADQQTTTFNSYVQNEPIPQGIIDSLSNNLWVTMAIELCPSNLVVRNLCLIDIVNSKPNNLDIIKSQLVLLGSGLWLEGYNYWIYTKPFIELYYTKFGYFKSYIDSMDLMFRLSAYSINDIIYPAPFGDVSNKPLENQDSIYIDNFSIRPLVKKTLIKGVIEYNIDKCILGLNTHVPSESTNIIVSNNVCVIQDTACVPFKWYEGYDKKYGNQIEELSDIFKKDRVNYILARKWWKKYFKIVNKF